MNRTIKQLNALLALLLIVCSNGINARTTKFNPPNFPKYETVVDQFFETYSTRNLQPGEILSFQKQPTGWHIAISDYYQGGAETLNELFWDASKRDYIKINFKLSGPNEDQSAANEKLKQSWNKRNFQLYPYFGYPGWDTDVIALLKDQDNLSDSLLNALARTYRVSADNLINPNNTGFAANGAAYDLPMTANSMNQEQLENYREYCNRSILTFKRLVKQNPDFPVLIGSVGTKMANERVVSFLDLRMFQNETEAKKELENCVYSEALIAMAKNSLESCSKNAILFTCGDNDTFPLLYVQSQLGFRQDVLIVNLSLLNTTRYINHLRNQILLAEAAPFSLNAAQIDGDLRSYIYVNNNDSVAMEVSDALTYILDTTNSVSTNNGIPLYQFPSNNLKISGKNGVMSFTFQEPYMYRSALMALDILSANQMERPVYFANGNTNNSFMGLNRYLSFVGLAIELGTTQNFPQNFKDLHVDTAKFYQNLMYTYDFSGLDKINRQDERLLSNYSKLFHQLSETFLIQGEEKKAKNVLNKWLDVIPEKRAYLDYYIPSLIVDFYQAGLSKRATNLADNFMLSLPSLLDPKTRKKLNNEAVNYYTLKVKEIKSAYK